MSMGSIVDEEGSAGYRVVRGVWGYSPLESRGNAAYQHVITIQISTPSGPPLSFSFFLSPFLSLSLLRCHINKCPPWIPISKLSNAHYACSKYYISLVCVCEGPLQFSSKADLLIPLLNVLIKLLVPKSDVSSKRSSYGSDKEDGRCNILL